MFGHVDADLDLLGTHSRWGDRIGSIVSELVSAGFLIERDGAYFVANFRRWQSRRTENVPKVYGRQKTEDRRQKLEVRGEKQSARFAREGAPAWQRLVDVRKELIPGARKVKPSADAKSAILKRIDESSPGDAIAVIDHAAGEVRRGGDAKWLNWITIFRKANYHRKLGMCGTEGPRDTTLHVVASDYQGDAGEVVL